MECGLFLDFWLSKIELLCILDKFLSGASIVMSFELLFKREIVRPCCTCMFSTFRNCVHVFQSGYIIFHSHLLHMSIATAWHLCQHLAYLEFSGFFHPCEWAAKFILVSMCISLMTKDVSVFIYLLSICIFLMIIHVEHFLPFFFVLCVSVLMLESILYMCEGYFLSLVFFLIL